MNNATATAINITASEKQSLIWTLEEEADVTRLMMQKAINQGRTNQAARLELELEGQASYIRAIQDGCA